MPFKKQPALYHCWRSMRDRCLNPKSKAWGRYGGRGITICEEWNSYAQFVADMGDRPSEKHSLDRIDNNLGYFKENCRWATKIEQQRNQERTRRVVIEGNEYLVSELHHQYGLKNETIVMRANKGMSFADVVRKTRYNFTGGVRRAIEVRVANQLAKTHCKHGHEWTPENTGRQKSGRYCKACHAAKVRRQHATKRSALSQSR